MAAQEIPLIATARQSLSVVLDNIRYGIRVYESTGVMCVDFTVNDVPLITGVRAVPRQSLIPYRYMQKTNGGNFAFATADNIRYPWWTDFDVTCRLFYETVEA